ncbi:MAG: aminopeptidase P family protein [Bacilli bacterium]|nr:aminopeptidase P family protein [Bacilli bacterium]
MINENIKLIQKELIKHNIGAYIVPTNDYHSSEYVSEYFKERKFLSGFTGSQGTLVITKNNSFLFVDGRYFIQAENQIKNTSITLMKMGEPGVPTLEEILNSTLQDGENLGVNAKYISIKQGLKYSNLAKSHNGQLVDIDLVKELWLDRPPLPKEKLWILEDKYSGEKISSKLARIRKIMANCQANSLLITTLDDIAWALNLRGNDIPCNPVFLSYLLIKNDNATLYIDQDKITNEVRDYLLSNNVSIKDYDDIASDLEKEIDKVMLETSKVNYSLYLHIHNGIIDEENPTYLMKAIKNDVEVENLKLAHIKDGVALTKFMYWLKTNVGKIEMSEISAQDYLYKLRSEQPNYIEPSFNTICGYKEHAAMMHYSATKETDVPLKKEGMLLVDSGGQYYEGTTDVTRTFILGPISKEEKHHFTLVLQANLNLHAAIFLEGCKGINLDILARGPIWDELIDYKCGTGHGVSYLMNVHEGPNGFRWKIVPERNDSGTLVPNMITTDEPGIYLEGKYGIRHETELLCVDKGTTEFGHFLGFECITLCPFDLDGINVDELTQKQKDVLNTYHKDVYEKLSPYMNEEERVFLEKYTRAV